MGDSPTWGYMKGFHVWREDKDRKKNESLLDLLEHVEDVKGHPEEAEAFEVELPGFLAEFQKLSHWDYIWVHGEVSVITVGDQGGGGIGWDWKSKHGQSCYNPKPKDLAALKKVLLKYGFKVGNRIEDDIWAYEG